MERGEALFPPGWFGVMLGLGVSETDRAKNRRNEKQEMSYFPVCLRGGGRLMFGRGPRKEIRQFIHQVVFTFSPTKNIGKRRFPFHKGKEGMESKKKFDPQFSRDCLRPSGK